MLRLLVVLTVIGVSCASMSLSRNFFKKWLDRKYGPGSMELYLKNTKDLTAENMILFSGFLFVLLIFMIPAFVVSIVFLIPEGIRQKQITLILVSLMIIVLTFFTVRGALKPYIEAKKWFSIPEEVRFSESFTDPFKQYDGIENVIRASCKKSLSLYILIGFIGFLFTAFICIFLTLLFPSTRGPVSFTIMAIGVVLAICFSTPSSFLIILKRRYRKLGDVDRIFAELNQQGETIKDTAPYTLRISPNYIFYSSRGLGNHIWKRGETRCSETLYYDENYHQYYLDMTLNGKQERIPISGKNVDHILKVICETCPNPDIGAWWKKQ